MAEASHHFGCVDVVIGAWTVVVKVQQAQETLLVTFLKDGQAPVYDCMIRVHEVHPVAAVIQVILGQCGDTEHVFIAEGNSWEGHVLSPHHVDLCYGGVRHQVEDSVPGPGAQETDAHKEGHDPDNPLQLRLVWGEDKLQTVDLCPHYEIHCDFSPRWFQRAGLFERSLLGVILSLWIQGA